MSYILEGLLFINNIDVFKQYGVFLSEEEEDSHENYSALLAPPAIKSYKAVDFLDEDGERLPSQLTPRLQARDFTLRFTMLAIDNEDFLAKYTLFVKMLRSGWLDLRVPELEKTYRVYYKNSSGYSQLTPFDDQRQAGVFNIVFREPKPQL